MDCVEVCPVDCFYEGENMLVIHPDECIDCGVCEPECPVEAIKPDTEAGAEKWLTLNADYAKSWAEVKALNIDVRFTPKSRHSSARAACPLWAKTGHDYMSLDNTEAANPK